MKIRVNGKTYKLSPFLDENELEQAVLDNSVEIFGQNSVFVDIKRKIQHDKNSFANIPDGYVVDFKEEPKLWIVENELAIHDAFTHIGIQLLKFATQFTDGSVKLKELLLQSINENPELSRKMDQLSRKRGFSNKNEALDYAVFHNDFGFVIVIDHISEDLSRVTAEIAKRPELLNIKKFTDGVNTVYLYDELLEELSGAKSTKLKSVEDIDTMVAPARAEGHASVFLKQKAWWAVRISPSIIPSLKFLAMYEVRPVSAIRWVGKISSIKPYEDSGKYKIYLSKVFKIKPIKMGKPNLAPYSPRYTKYELLEKAKTLADIF